MSVEKVFTLEQVIRWAAEITGKGIRSNRDYLIDLVRETLEVLENQESMENLRKWCVCSCGCSFTAPNEMGQPLKYKLGNKVGPVRSKAYEFRGYQRKDNCDLFSEDIRYLGEFPTYYDGPKDCPFRLSAIALDQFGANEAPYLIVQAEDEAGNPVVTKDEDGKTTLGVKVPIARPYDQPIYSQEKITKIIDVQVMDCSIRTNLMWVKADWGKLPSEFGLLSCYSPGQSRGCFQRYSINERLDEDCCYQVEILGRLALPNFKFDNELIIGFDSSSIRSMLRAKRAQSENDIQVATFNSNIAMSNLKKMNERKLKDTDTFHVSEPASAGKFPKVY